jgi:hypothetical protein
MRAPSTNQADKLRDALADLTTILAGDLPGDKQATQAFRDCLRQLRDFILGQSISPDEKSDLIEKLIVAVSIPMFANHLVHVGLNKLKRDVYGATARRGYEADSARIQAIVERRARQLWGKNKNRKGNARGTAHDIFATVKADIEKEGIQYSRPLTEDGVRRRITKILPSLDD